MFQETARRNEGARREGRREDKAGCERREGRSRTSGRHEGGRSRTSGRHEGGRSRAERGEDGGRGREDNGRGDRKRGCNDGGEKEGGDKQRGEMERDKGRAYVGGRGDKQTLVSRGRGERDRREEEGRRDKQTLVSRGRGGIDRREEGSVKEEGRMDKQISDSRGKSERSRETMPGSSREKSRRVEVVSGGRDREREDSRMELERRKRVTEVRRKAEERRKMEERSSSSRDSREDGYRGKITTGDGESSRDHKRIVLFKKKDEASEQRKHEDETNYNDLTESKKEANTNKGEEEIDLQLPEEELSFFDSKTISPESGNIGEPGAISAVDVGKANETSSQKKGPFFVIEEETLHEGEATEEEALDGKEEFNCFPGKEEEAEKKLKLVEEINNKLTKVAADIAVKKEEIAVKKEEIAVLAVSCSPL